MKKKFTLPNGIGAELNSVVDFVNNNIGSLNYKIVPISAIEFDPQNPRELTITREDLPQGPDSSDVLYEQKLKEFESLKMMAETIKKYGVRNPVEIYKHGSNYRLIHGERRCLSSIIAGKKEIPAKILDERPNDFDIRLLQLIENIQREDLSLYETLNNIQQIIREYKNHVDPHVEVNSNLLEGLINCSKPHCLNYLVVLNAPDALQELIKKGEIKNLEKAATIARSKSEEEREKLINICLNGGTLKEMKKAVSEQKKVRVAHSSLTPRIKKRPGKSATKVKLGSTTNKAVISKLIKLVSEDPLYSKFKEKLNQLHTNDFSESCASFLFLLRIMEKVESH